MLIVEDGVATITLSQPDKLNAITREMADKFPRIIEKVRLVDSVEVLIVKGAERRFCAGANLARHLAAAEEIREERWQIISPLS